MKKVYNKISDVIELWVNQSQSEAKAGNVFFEKNIIYSYGNHYPIAVIYKDIVLINNKSYSVTTQKHKNWVKWALNNKFDYVEVKDPENALNPENLKDLRDKIKELKNKYKKAYLQKQWRYESFFEVVNYYRKFKNVFYHSNKSDLIPSELKLRLIKHQIELILADREKRRIEGVLIPKDLFKHYQKKTITPEMILKCRNAEVRSILLKNYGYGRLINQFKHKIIDKDIKKDYELVRLYIPKNETIKDWQGNITRELPEDIMLIKVKDTSTGTFYVLRVPLEVKTCLEAIAWTFRMTPDEYKLEVEA